MSPRSAARVATLVLGLYAAALGAAHGVFAWMQGPVAPTGLVFAALGPPCVPSAWWHACLPALTLATDLQSAAAATLLAASLTVIATVTLVQRPASMALATCGFALFVAGGGFVATFTALAAATAAWPRPAGESGASPSWLWPWALGAFLVWGSLGWWLANQANEALLRLGGATFALDLVLPFAVAFTARAPVATRVRRVRGAHTRGR